MAIGSVGVKEFYDKIRFRQGNKPADNRSGSFSGDIGAREDIQAEDVNKRQASVQTENRSGRIATELFVQGAGRSSMAAVMERSVRHIAQEESHKTKAYPAEGFMLKVQVDLSSHMVYVEQKNEDGTYQAYDVNPFLVSEQTKSPITQIAMEAWIEAKKAENGGEDTEKTEEAEKTDKKGAGEDPETARLSAFEQQLLEFKEYVRERLKDGPPKILTGGSEFTEEEWEKLIRKIDRDIDAYKEELRERIRKREEAEAIQKTTGSVTDTAQEALDTVSGKAGASGSTLDQKGQDGLILSENEALEGIENNAPRGSSLLARLSGEKKAPYSYLADASGTIVYKGVVFQCDDKKRQICLGDVSNPKNVINIPLSKGGCLRVNRDNIGDLAKAISMFSSEDIGRIMRAIAQDKKAQEVEWELEVSKRGGVQV